MSSRRRGPSVRRRCINPLRLRQRTGARCRAPRGRLCIASDESHVDVDQFSVRCGGPAARGMTGRTELVSWDRACAWRGEPYRISSTRTTVGSRRSLTIVLRTGEHFEICVNQGRAGEVLADCRALVARTVEGGTASVLMTRCRDRRRATRCEFSTRTEGRWPRSWGGASAELRRAGTRCCARTITNSPL